MKLIYEYTVQNKSYTENTWDKHQYFLCDDMQEYNNIYFKHLRRAKKIQEDFDANPEDICAQYRWLHFHLLGQRDIQAIEYYQCHEWMGKHFQARGFSWSEEMDGNATIKYYLMPDSITDEGISKRVDIPNGNES